MDTFSLLGIITFGVIFISLLFATFLFTVTTKNKLSNRLIAFYFIVFSIHMSVFIYAKYVDIPLTLDRLRDQIIFLSSPLLYLYVLSAVYSDFKLKPIHLLHFIPFFIEVFVYFPRFYLVNNEQRILFYNSFNSNLEVKFSAIYAVLIVVFYLTLIFLILKKYKAVLLENYSYKKSFNYKWLHQFFVLLSIIFIFSVIKQIYKFYGSDIDTLNIIRVILTLLLLCFLSWIVLMSMYKPELFKGIDTKHQLVNTIIKNKTLNNEHLETIKRLQEYMETKEPYLDAFLTIKKLAEQLNIPTNELSILINHELGKHFFDFVNEYRIKKAIHLFKESNDIKLTVLEVLFEVGFNSKSPFNTAFKKFTGLTPTQYRNTQL
ncbi:MAG: AraC family transcriptional regulator [Winogradskyella sp.]|nr:MAG: AraC family transcriptional regulator [Winogradskyella sp.]